MATINGTSVGGMTLQIDYSYTQNTTANTTTVTAKFIIAKLLKIKTNKIIKQKHKQNPLSMKIIFRTIYNDNKPQ